MSKTLRPEVRIIKMTEAEYNAAMHQFLGDDYDDEKDNYWDHLMSEFDEQYGAIIDAAYDNGYTYLAVICDENGEPIENRTYELPENFNPNDFEFEADSLNM